MTREEFIHLYDGHVALVRSVLARVVPGGSARLDDLTQDVFLRAWRSRDGFRGEAQARTWLCRIARNVALDLLKSASHTRERAEAAEPVTSAADTDPSDRVAVQQLLATLGPDERLLMVMLCVEGFTMVEIGQVLEIPEGTAKSRAFALRARLRETFRDCYREAVAGPKDPKASPTRSPHEPTLGRTSRRASESRAGRVALRVARAASARPRFNLE